MFVCALWPRAPAGQKLPCIDWSWYCRWLGATMWAMGVEPDFSAKTSATTLWTFSPDGWVAVCLDNGWATVHSYHGECASRSQQCLCHPAPVADTESHCGLFWVKCSAAFKKYLFIWSICWIRPPFIDWIFYCFVVDFWIFQVFWMLIPHRIYWWHSLHPLLMLALTVILFVLFGFVLVQNRRVCMWFEVCSRFWFLFPEPLVTA